MTEKMAAVIDVLQFAIFTLFYMVLCSSSEDVKFNNIKAVLCGPDSELFNINSLTSSEYVKFDGVSNKQVKTF